MTAAPKPLLRGRGLAMLSVVGMVDMAILA